MVDMSYVASPGLQPGTRSAATEVLRLPANEAPEHDRPELLREFFQRLGVRYDVSATGTEPVGIDLTLRRFPGVQFSSGRLQGAHYVRRRESNDPAEDVGLVVSSKGRMFLGQCGREIVLDSGEATLVRFTETLDSAHRAPGDMLVMRIPRLQLAPRLTDPDDCVLRRIPRSTPALKLLTGYVNLVECERVPASEDMQHLIVPHCYDLAAVAIGATRDAVELAQGRGLRAARLLAIKQDIAGQLDRADLSVAALSVRHGCTPRFIQRLFESEGTTFTDYVLAQRLASAHRLLTDPRHAAEKISSIAVDVGFGDLSYFNRAFRRRYGETPSGIRAQLQAHEAALM